MPPTCNTQVTSFLPVKRGTPIDLVFSAIKSNAEISDSSDDPDLRKPGVAQLLLERIRSL